MKVRANSEEALCHQLAQYLRLKHPDLIWHFDYGSGLKMTMSQAVRQKALNGRAFPDLFIAALRFMPGTVDLYGGLFIELKKDGTRLRKRDGSWASDHIAEQAAVLDRLQGLGYCAVFAVGFDESVEVIESYLSDGVIRQLEVPA